MKLYSYYRSSAAYRIRIALNIKGIDWETIPVDLLNGEDAGDAYRAINPQGVVPSLAIDSKILHQSMAILEYLEETHPTPALLPADAQDRAQVRALANVIACDIHPLNNLKVLKYLVGKLGISEEQKLTWYADWINEGFHAFEQLLQSSQSNDKFCFGDAPTIADINLVPQVYNANRFNVELAAFPRIVAINEHCLTMPAFANAAPENQPDAPDDL